MDGGEEGGGVFGVAGRDAAPALEMQKGVLNKVTMSIEVRVILSLLLPILAGRDHRAHALSGGLRDEGITVVTLVGQQVLGAESVD